jgi:hypothetical protein
MDENELISSIESLLSVPFQFIFPIDNLCKIFSVNEAKELLDVHLVSSEMDCLLQLMQSLLRRRCQCKNRMQRLVSVCKNSSTMWAREDDDEQQLQPEGEEEEPTVELLGSTMDIPVSVACRSIVPILHTHMTNYCQKQYEYIHQQLANCLHKLSRSSQRILTFYEQNEAMADQLQLANIHYDDAIHPKDTDGKDPNLKKIVTSPFQLLLQQKCMAVEILHTIHERIIRLSAMDGGESLMTLLTCGKGHPAMEDHGEQQRKQVAITAEDTMNNHETNSHQSMGKICQSLQMKYLNSENSTAEHEMKHDNMSTSMLQSLAETNDKSSHNDNNKTSSCNNNENTSSKRKRKNSGICLQAQTQMKRWKGIAVAESNDVTNSRIEQLQEQQQEHNDSSKDSQMNAAEVLAQFHSTIST